MRTLLIAAALIAPALALSAAPALAAGPITVEKPWARPAASKSLPSAAYFTLRNSGPADVLEGVSTPVARASAHMTMDHGGMSMMHASPATPIPAGGMVEFKPGGLHVMLEGLKAPLAAGDRVPLTLTFKKAGKVVVDVPVQPTAP
jgi:hypothetical protein